LQDLLTGFFQILLSKDLEFAVKKHIFLVFDSLLLIYQGQEDNIEKLQNFYGNIFAQIQGPIISDDLRVAKGALLICQAGLQSIRSIHFLNKVFAGMSRLLCQVVDKYVQLLTRDLMIIQASSSQDLSLENPVIQSLLSSLDIV
jgi:hypothetical protein